jgi:hypothetical protein
MMKRTLFSFFLCVVGAFTVYFGVVGYLHNPQSDGLFLAKSIFSCLIGALCILGSLQSFSKASRGSRATTFWVLMSTVWVYGTLDLLTGDPDERLAFLVFMGLLAFLLLTLFAVALVRAFGWRRGGAKALDQPKAS